MKRDMDLEGEKEKCEKELVKQRSLVDQSLDFILSVRKDLVKLLKQIEKKHDQYIREEEEEQ